MLMLSLHGIWSLFFCHPELVEGSLPLVPKFHLGTRLPRQFHCRSRRGNPCANQRKMEFREKQGTFPNYIWIRGTSSARSAYLLEWSAQKSSLPLKKARHPELVEGSLPLVPKFHLGTRLPRQFHCRPRRGNPCTNQRKMKFREKQGTFPNEI